MRGKIKRKTCKTKFTSQTNNTCRRVTAILYWAQIVAWALMSAPRDWSFASARKPSSKQDNASDSWFCSRWTSPVLKQTEAAAPRGTCNKKITNEYDKKSRLKFQLEHWHQDDPSTQLAKSYPETKRKKSATETSSPLLVLVQISQIKHHIK